MKTFLLTLVVVLASTAHASDQKCATVYAAADFQDSALEISSGQAISDLAQVVRGGTCSTETSNWDHQIASLQVNPGCTLVAYQYRGFGINEQTGRHFGSIAVWYADIGSAGTMVRDLRNLKGHLSSLRCVCDSSVAPTAPVVTPAPAPAPSPAPANQAPVRIPGTPWDH